MPKPMPLAPPVMNATFPPTCFMVPSVYWTTIMSHAPTRRQPVLIGETAPAMFNAKISMLGAVGIEPTTSFV
jgi:hypothetical protein